jgi:hypothetical protein
MKYSDRHISDEELDQLFRDAHASEGQEALFVPEFWSEMEAMLPAETKKKRGFYWIPLTAAVILIGTLLIYPLNPVKIERIAHQPNENKIGSGSVAIETYQLKEKETSVIADNSAAQSSEQVSGKSQIKTTFRAPKTHLRATDLRNQKNTAVVEEMPQNPQGENRIPQNPENTVVVTNPDPHSHSDSHSVSEDDFVRLEPRYESVPHEEITPLPELKSRESNEWYAELGPTFGQSPYLSPNQKRNLVSGAVFGGGYTKRIDNAFVSFGLQARLEGFGGLEYRETNFTPNIVRTVSVKQLYSLEIPLKFGYTFRRSEFALAVVPGIQLFIHGKERITENQVVKREETFTGKVEHSNSLTMEFGLQYYYNFNPKWGVGAKINADILRPFHTDYYLGQSTGLPVNGQILLRRRFAK